MKIILYSGSLLSFLLPFLVSTTSCAQCDRITTLQTDVFIDITDAEHFEALQQYMAQEYVQLVGYFDKSKAFDVCHASMVNIYPLNDKGENRALTSTYQPVTSSMTETQINRQVKPPFYESIKKNLKATLSLRKDDTQELAHTRIYEPLCLLLNRYNKIRQPLHIIVYSDLLEHNTVSFYQRGKAIPTEKTLKALETNCHCTLPEDLSFLRISLISFRTKENDRLIGSARNFWEAIFTTRNAKVYTGAGLQASFFAPVSSK